MHDILTFHPVHGASVSLSDDRNGATRDPSSISDSIVFSAQPVGVNQRVSLHLTNVIADLCGAVRFGFISNDPATSFKSAGPTTSNGSSVPAEVAAGVPPRLPPYLMPDVSSCPGCWARAPLDQVSAESGAVVTLYFNTAGNVYYLLNKKFKGLLLTGVPTDRPVWLVVDVYGNTTSVKLIRPDEGPEEIIARGPAALNSYQCACESGAAAIYRTRLVIVGQDDVLRNALKSTLIGLRDSPARPVSCTAIDLSCSLNLSSRSTWRATLSPRSQLFPVPSDASEDGLNDCSTSDQEQEQERIIAMNLCLELMRRERLKHLHATTTTTTTTTTSSSTKNDNAEESSTTVPEPLTPTSIPPAGAPLDKDGSTQLSEQSSSQDKSMASPGVTDTASPETKAKHGKTSKRKTPQSYAHNELLADYSDNIKRNVDSIMLSKLRTSKRLVVKEKIIDTPKSIDRCEQDILLDVVDCGDDFSCCVAQKVFLSSRAVYLLTFDLATNLDSDPESEEVKSGCRISQLEYIDYWLNFIHSQAARSTCSIGPSNAASSDIIFPRVFIVGTTNDSGCVKRDDLVDAQFQRIRSLIRGRPYERHVRPKYYAVPSEGNTHFEQMRSLQRDIEDSVGCGPFMGELVPERWLRFESAIDKLVNSGTRLCKLSQLHEVAIEEDISDRTEFKTMLQYYHDTGSIVCVDGACSERSNETVILQPSWLVSMCNVLLSPSLVRPYLTKTSDEVLWQQYSTSGALCERLVDLVWEDSLFAKTAILSLLENLDLLAQRNTHDIKSSPARKFGRSYIVPSLINNDPSDDDAYCPSNHDVVFYFNFHGFLPNTLFSRLVVCSYKWTCDSGDSEPLVFRHWARFVLDNEHDFILDRTSRYLSRIKVIVLRIVEADRVNDDSNNICDSPSLYSPKPYAAAKVRAFLETTIRELRETQIKRMSYNTCVKCLCDKLCMSHKQPNCMKEDCAHFLSLDECLSNKVVCCDHRRIKTAIYCRGFPQPAKTAKEEPVIAMLDNQKNKMTRNREESFLAGNADDLPGWVKNAAKMLNGGSEGQDWIALAQKLGYKKSAVEKFSLNQNPGLSLLVEWIVSSGNTSLSVDLMITYLEQLQRDDIVDVIRKGQEPEVDAPQAFISYQWDNQDEVTCLRDVLETNGLSCWMDIGQMGGGDFLYSKIYEGIKHAKVVIACLTPKYIVSHHCSRELALADLLQKPIIPVMYDWVPWPPSGPMSLIFSQLVYINLKGVGGHGGSGLHSDLNSKYQEIVSKVSNFATPKTRPFVDLYPKSSEVSAREKTKKKQNGRESQERGARPNDSVNDYQQEVVRSPSRARSTHDRASSRGDQIETVNVTKCTVCIIL